MRRQEVRRNIERGGKPRYRWVDAEKRWLQERKNKKSIYDDIAHFEFLSPHFSHLFLDEIDKIAINLVAQKKEDQNVAPATVNRLLALIRAVLNCAYKFWGWTDGVPFIKMRKEDNARNRWLTYEEAELLLSYLPKHLKDMARFALSTGLRASNIFKLEWQDVNLIDKYLIVHDYQNKTGKFLCVPLTPEAQEVIRDQIGNHEKYVFIYKGKPVTQLSTKAFRNALKKANIKDFRWHDFRHTWASWHVQNGTSLQDLMALGGWSTYEMVLRYAHLSINQLRKSANNISGFGAKMVNNELKIVK